MFAFKVMVSTLVIVLMIFLIVSGTKSNESGQKIAAILVLVNALSVIAIWG